MHFIIYKAKTMRELSLEYVAGFFDADGSIGVYNRGNGIQICASIANSGHHGRIICNQLQQRFRGTVTCAKLKNPNHRDVFWWRTNGRNVVKNFLEQIVEHSVIKKDQIELAILFIKAWEKMPRYKSDQDKLWIDNLVKEMKEMKRTC
jgi:hypothetical protein